MVAPTKLWMKAALLALSALGMTQAGAQTAAYRCVSGGTVSYSQVPCPGGRLVLGKPRHVTDKSRPPPQDRAVAAKRAVLTPEERQECKSLDQGMAREERFLHSKGEGATLDDEMPLVHMKKRFRELKC